MNRANWPERWSGCCSDVNQPRLLLTQKVLNLPSWSLGHPGPYTTALLEPLLVIGCNEHLDHRCSVDEPTNWMATMITLMSFLCKCIVLLNARWELPTQAIRLWGCHSHKPVTEQEPCTVISSEVESTPDSTSNVYERTISLYPGLRAAIL